LKSNTFKGGENTSFQEPVKTKIEELEKAIYLLKSWLLITKSPDWHSIDDKETVATQQYAKLRQHVIDVAAQLPTA